MDSGDLASVACAAAACCNDRMIPLEQPAPAWGPRRIGRLALLVVLLWVGQRLAARAWNGCFIDLANLAFHEAGHVFLRPFGHVVHVLGGTIFQLLVPGLLVWYFLIRRREAFAAAVCLWWLGESLTSVAVYMADARELQLDLVGGGEHDWNELFFHFHLLDEASVATISATTHGLGVVLMLLGLAWAGVFVLPRAVRSGLVLRLAGIAPRAVRLLDDGPGSQPT
jgi:hypothetical protein